MKYFFIIMAIHLSYLNVYANANKVIFKDPKKNRTVVISGAEFLGHKIISTFCSSRETSYEWNKNFPKHSFWPMTKNCSWQLGVVVNENDKLEKYPFKQFEIQQTKIEDCDKHCSYFSEKFTLCLFKEKDFSKCFQNLFR